jgi:hypothetical protein
MFDMSAAAIAPRYPSISAKDREHPRFREYNAYLSGMIRLGVQASCFSDWLSCSEANERQDSWAEHPQYPAFLAWMRETKAGARKCRPSKDFPEGRSFPENFKIWLTGERW